MQNAENIGATNNVRFPPEAVSEMSIVTTAYSAEYGQTGGGVQRYEIKSGSNSYHGNVYEYLKNTDLDARAFFNIVRPVDRQNEYGFSIGGPVSIPKLYNGKNRSFFFFDADWFKTQGASATSIVSLPNAAFRNGDFSGNLVSAVPGATNPCGGGAVINGQIFDPLTTQTVNGQQCRTAFPGNVIPASRISPAAQKVMAMLPPTNTQATLNNADCWRRPASITLTTTSSRATSISHPNTISAWSFWILRIPPAADPFFPLRSPPRVLLTIPGTSRAFPGTGSFRPR